MKIENLRKVATIGLALGAINNTLAIPLKETKTDLKKCGVWQDEAISNTCVIPKEVNNKDLQRVHEVLRETGEGTLGNEKFGNYKIENETKTLDKCRWNDYVGMTLAVGSSLVMMPISKVLVTSGMLVSALTGIGPNRAFHWMILDMGITLLPTYLIEKAFRVDEECARIISDQLFEKYRNWKYTN